METTTPNPNHKKNGKKARAHNGKPSTNGELTQGHLFDEEQLRQVMTTAVDLMWMIEINPAQTIQEVKEQEQAYNKCSFYK